MLTPTVIKLHQGQDLKVELDRLAKRRSLKGSHILTCTGSLAKVVLRYSSQSRPLTLQGHFEVVSLAGSLSTVDSHYRLIIDDGERKSSEAQLLEGSIVHTSMKIVIGGIGSINFSLRCSPQKNIKEMIRLLQP